MSRPPRTADTMSDAIALSSPCGRMSKRASEDASRRLAKALWGDHCTREDITGTAPEASRKEYLLAHAARLRALASRGMSVRKFNRDADKAEAEAAAL